MSEIEQALVAELDLAKAAKAKLPPQSGMLPDKAYFRPQRISEGLAELARQEAAGRNVTGYFVSAYSGEIFIFVGKDRG